MSILIFVKTFFTNERNFLQPNLKKILSVFLLLPHAEHLN